MIFPQHNYVKSKEIYHNKQAKFDIQSLAVSVVYIELFNVQNSWLQFLNRSSSNWIKIMIWLIICLGLIYIC